MANGKGGFWPPRELSEADVKEIISAQRESAKLAVKTGCRCDRDVRCGWIYA
jgi:hypothetical protein